VAFVLVFGLAIAPILLAIGSREAVLITVGVGAMGLLVLAAYLWLAAGAALSLVLQPIRRACVLENQGLLASVRTGIRITLHHLKEAGLIWLIWMGIRLLWIPLGALVAILLAPVLLLAVLTGVALSGVPAALVALVTALFTSGATPWIMGLLAGIPIFILVAVSPVVFVNGLVEVYISSLWTLAYRELKALERPVQAPAPRAQAAAAPGPAD
jgi:hypothetical protein